MSKLPLTIAVSRYDHVADLLSGAVTAEGIDLNPLDLPLHDVFQRFIHYKDFDIGEVSMAKYVSMRSQGDDALIALPVFPSRVVRHSSIYIRRDGPVKSPKDLEGKRVGVPEWAQTAAVYSRGMLAHVHGVDLASIKWTQAGVHDAGRRENVALKLPAGLELTPRPDKSLAGLLVDGELDAVLSATPLDPYLNGHPAVGRMFEDFVPAETDYIRSTGIIPIMHTIAVRKQVLDAHPWVAGNLLHAFTHAKTRSVERMLDGGMTHAPILWCYEYARQTAELFGGEAYPYGVEANRRTLEAFLQYAYEQGVCHRHLKVEGIFPPQTLRTVRV